jgi:hypothetical protein
MTVIANLRTNVGVPFPALVQGSVPIAVTRNGGIWTLGLSFDLVSQHVPLAGEFTTDYLLVYDSLQKTFIKISISDFQALLTNPAPTIDQVAGTYTVTSEQTLLIKKTVPAAHNIQLPTAASRNGINIIIKDVAGNAAANVATILPSGGETIDGLASLPINANYGGFNLAPLPASAGTGWYISP